MATRTQRRNGKRHERGGRISEGKNLSSLNGYKKKERRPRVGRREIDAILKRGEKTYHYENSKTTVNLTKMKGYWDKFNQTRIATKSNKLMVKGKKYTIPAKKFASKKGIILK
jgi:hypothetical protein